MELNSNESRYACTAKILFIVVEITQPSFAYLDRKWLGVNQRSIYMEREQDVKGPNRACIAL